MDVEYSKRQAFETVFWFFSAFNPDYTDNLGVAEVEQLTPVDAIFKGTTLVFDHLITEEDFSLIPATVSGYKGLKLLQGDDHKTDIVPNTIFYTQTGGFDNGLNSQQHHVLLFYNPKNKTILDLEIEGTGEDDAFLINVHVFVPDEVKRQFQLKRYIHYRRQACAAIIEEKAGRILSSFMSLNHNRAEDKARFYERLMKTETANIRRRKDDVLPDTVNFSSDD